MIEGKDVEDFVECYLIWGHWEWKTDEGTAVPWR